MRKGLFWIRRDGGEDLQPNKVLKLTSFFSKTGIENATITCEAASRGDNTVKMPFRRDKAADARVDTVPAVSLSIRPAPKRDICA